MICCARGGPRLGSGRPPAPPEEKHHPRSFKCTDSEWQQIRDNAAKENLNVSEYIRRKTLQP